MNIWISSRDFMSSWKSSGVSTDFFPVHQRRSDYKRWCFKVFPPRKSPGPRGNEEKGIRIWVKQRMIGGFKMLKKWIRALFFFRNFESPFLLWNFTGSSHGYWLLVGPVMKSFRVGQRNPGIPATSTAWWFFALPQPEKSWSERQLGWWNSQPEMDHLGSQSCLQCPFFLGRLAWRVQTFFWILWKTLDFSRCFYHDLCLLWQVQP